MLYVSIHANPAENYPFLSGYEDEVRDYRIEYALSVYRWVLAKVLDIISISLFPEKRMIALT